MMPSGTKPVVRILLGILAAAVVARGDGPAERTAPAPNAVSVPVVSESPAPQAQCHPPDAGTIRVRLPDRSRVDPQAQVLPVDLSSVQGGGAAQVFGDRPSDSGRVTLQEVVTVAQRIMGLASAREAAGGGIAPVASEVHEFRKATDATGTPGEQELGDDNHVLGYVVAFEPAGFVVTTASTKIEPIVCYSYAASADALLHSDNPLLDILYNDLYNRDRLSRDENPQVSTNARSWRQLLSTSQHEPSTPSRDAGHLLQTNWHQFSPYNNSCPDRTAGQPWIKRPVGCIATAMAQVIHYYRYPSTVSFTQSDRYYSNSGWHTIRIDEDASAYSFPTLAQLSDRLATIDYAGDPNEEADLCFAAGIAAKLNYSKDETGTQWNRAGNALKNKFSYGSARRSGLLDTNPWPGHRSKVIASIQSERPCMLFVTGVGGGHCVVADGYDTTQDLFHLK